MKIDLMYFINKQRIDLQKFCELNNITSYKELKNLCTVRKFICVDEKFYNSNVQCNIGESKAPHKTKSLNEKVETNSQPKRTRTQTKARRSRKASEKTKVRNNSKASKS